MTNDKNEYIIPNKKVFGQHFYKTTEKKRINPFSSVKRGFLMKKISTITIARAGITACAYLVLSLLTLPVMGGAIQFRISEALCVLPLIFPETAIGLWVGCMLSNLLGACAPLDVIFGSLITLVAGGLTYFVGKKLKKTSLKIIIGGLFPVLLNAILLPVIWQFAYGILEYAYPIQVLFLIVSQSLSIYGLGIVLYLNVNRILNKKNPEK